ncbi:hypothetical protein HZS_3884 [Henneguya salminicola]|nr:hypothetical protein HZS_3884 [Henneguya salminicola]
MNELNLDANNEDQQESIEIKNESEDKEDESTVKRLIIKNMNAAFMHLDTFLAMMEECDPNGESIS